MAYPQGSIVLVENPYADGLRPVLVASNSDRPFQGKQYTFAIISTTEREEAVRLDSADITEGSLNVHPSFVNPWSVHEVEHAAINRRVAQTADDVVERVADGIERFHEPR
jgi:mRNA-degrading endonuclease toxin of MazEF toxin-antitoxin module